MFIAAAPTTAMMTCRFPMLPIQSVDSSKPRPGFGTKTNHKRKKKNNLNQKKTRPLLQLIRRELVFSQGNKIADRSVTNLTKAPGLNSRFDGKVKRNLGDLEFEEHLVAIRSSALERKKTVEKEEYGAIDYNTPVKSEEKKKLDLEHRLE